MSLVIHPGANVVDFRSWTESNPPVATKYKLAQIGMIAGCALSGIAATVIGYIGILPQAEAINDPHVPIGVATGVVGNAMILCAVWTTWSALSGFHTPYPRPVTAEPRSAPLLLPDCVLDKRELRTVQEADRAAARGHLQREQDTHGYYYGSV